MAVKHTCKKWIGLKSEIATEEITPIKAIRQNCLECSGGSYVEVKNCPIKTCAYYPYRLGKNPACRKDPNTPASEIQPEIAGGLENLDG
jgi:hypothetical protein